MHSKSIAIAILFTLSSIFLASNAVNAAIAIKPTVGYSDSTQQAAIVQELISRVNAIQQMDKSNLSSAERADLKKELKALKHKANGLDQRVYISVGAVIVVILLLILLLR